MATIDDLNKSISQMPDGELLDLLRSVRASRRTHKIVGTKTQARPKVKLQVSALSMEQRESLIAELEGMM